jgi:hypothetical protein
LSGLALRWAGFLLLIGVVAGLSISAARTNASHDGGMDAMSIDMNVAGNTATSLGPRDECVEVSLGGTITLDVTATNFPASTAMIAFGITLLFPAGIASGASHDSSFLLNATPGSSVIDVTAGAEDDIGKWTLSH